MRKIKEHHSCDNTPAHYHPNLMLLSRIRIMFAFAYLSLLLVIGGWTWQSWHSTKQRELEHLSTTVEVTAASMDSYFSEREAQVNNIGKALLAAHHDQPRLSVLLAQLKTNDSEVLFSTVTGLDGQLLALDQSSNMDRRPDARVFPSSKTAFNELEQVGTLNIGTPIKSILSNSWITPLRVGIRDKSGSLQLVVNMALPLTIRQSLWQHVTLPVGSTMGLLRDDAFLISRYPAVDKNQSDTVFKSARNGALVSYLHEHAYPKRGTVEGYNSVTHTQNLFAFCRLDRYPLTVFISAPVKSISKHWIEQLYIPLLLAFFSSAVGILLYRNIVKNYWTSHKFEALRTQSEQQLHQAASVFNSTCEGISISDKHGVILNVNDAFTHITGFSRDEVLGRNHRILSSGRQSPEFYAEMWRTLQESGHWVGEL